jgi:hypothetical protein
LVQQKLWDALKQIPRVSENWQSLEIVFETGAEIHLKSVETYKTAEGLEYDAWFADEFQDHSEEAVRVFHTRTRKARERSLFRIVGMPDDPLHFMYSYFAENGYTLNEISLYEHPSQEWIDYYEAELKKVYKGAELDRFLYGKRVSLTGVGAFTVSEINQTHEDYYDQKQELHLVWDFNYEYRAVVVGQFINKNIEVIRSFQMKEATVEDDAVYLANYFANHQGAVYLRGDASGDSRSAQATESMWQKIRKVFVAKFGSRLRYAVPKSNPSVKDTIQLTKWALMTSRIRFNKNLASTALMAVTAAKLDKYGEIDKSNDYKNVAAKSHEVDVIRYLAYDLLNLEYHGINNRKGFFI